MTPEQMEDTNNIDSMLLLEGKLLERVSKIVNKAIEMQLVNIIGKEIQRVLKDEKNALLMEVSIKVGQMLKGIAEDDRKPLWDHKPEDFGLDDSIFKGHSMKKLEDEDD